MKSSTCNLSTDCTETRRSLLDQVLPKLRPFQREAVEFATKGKQYERQFATPTDTNDDNIIATKKGKTIMGGKKTKRNDKSQSVAYELDEQLLGKGRILLGDEMGLGKTVTSLAIMANYEMEWPLLIICPASLRYTWPAEIEKFFPSIPAQSVYVVTGFQDVAFVRRGDVKIVVVTYSLLQNRSAVSHALVNECSFQCVIVDESHNMKQKSSQRTQLMMPLLSRAKRLVFLSGTPALARPVELWPQLYCLAPKLFGSWNEFTKRYCNPQRKNFGRGRFTIDYTGSSNEVELHQKLLNVMVRRLKCHVLSELPPKQRSIVPIQIIDREQRKLCLEAMELLNQKRMSISELLGSEAMKADFEAKSALMRAYQQTGIGKAQCVADYLTDCWIPGTSKAQKILVFCHHKGVMDTIDQALIQKYPNSHIRIDGSVPTVLRGQLVQKFQTCGRIRVALLSMTAAGVGLTLTAASTVLFAELHWTPGVLSQAEDRAHRIGQCHDSVQIMYMVCKDSKLSIDGLLWNMLGRKINTLDQVVDGGNDNKPYLYDAKEGASENIVSHHEGLSVQADIARFFAEANDNTPQRKKTAMKGSIEQFFLKQSKNCNPTTSLNPIQSNTNETPTMQEQSKKDQRRGTDINLSNIPRDITWHCKTCTFRNTNQQNPTGCYSCEICGNPFVPSSIQSDRETGKDVQSSILIADSPESTGRLKKLPSAKSDSWNCQACLFVNNKPIRMHASNICEFCGDHVLPSGAKDDCYNHNGAVVDTPILHRRMLDVDDVETNSPARSSGQSATRAVRVSLSSTASKSERSRSATQAQSSPEFIVIDNFPSSPRRFSDPSELAVIRMDREIPERVAIGLLNDGLEHASLPNLDTPMTSGCPELAFSVSKNTGRISVHVRDIDVFKSTEVNFHMEEVLSSDTSARLLGPGLTRSATRSSPLELEFKEDILRQSIKNVVNSVAYKNVCNTTQQTTSHEADIKKFVNAYVRLREVEKKLLRDSGGAFPSSRLNQAVAKLVNTSQCRTERYEGGAKERALRNVENGSATDGDHDLLDGKACFWCGSALSVSSRLGDASYCSQICAEEGRLRRGGKFASRNLRLAVFAIEGGNCSMCGLNAHDLFKQIELMDPPQRLNKLLSVNWKLPKSAKALENLLQQPKEGNFWQVDHIKAVSEGGGSCGLENLRTLCVPCHLGETEKLHGRLQLLNPEATNQTKDSGSTTKRKQIDIREAFFGASKRIKGNADL